MSGCVVHAAVPTTFTRDARFGYAPLDFDAPRACGDWMEATDGHLDAQVHASFPEERADGCFVPIHYDGATVTSGAIPDGCGYPTDAAIGVLPARAGIYQRVATSSEGDAPLELACDLPEPVRRAAASVNARTLASFAADRASGADARSYPYAIAGTFGYGNAKQDASAIAKWRPDDACVDLDAAELARLDVNVIRAQRAAAAFHAGVAPFVSLSGGAVHSSVYEAFLLMHLVTCELGVPKERVLLDPCADHTHTNIRNTGALVAGVGGRFAYLVTDDGLQSGYLEEWTFFDVILGSIDQRALRDFGYLIGSWRRASVGMRAGYWFTPFRFWAESPRDLGSFSCVGDVAR
jgi:hypothetical protein